MGKKLPAKLEDGSIVEIGSTTLVLECDEWTITRRGKQIANSDSINLDLVNGSVWKYFSDKPLNDIHFTNKPKRCTIFFGEQGVIVGEVVIQLKGEADEDMCTITFPKPRPDGASWKRNWRVGEFGSGRAGRISF